MPPPLDPHRVVRDPTRPDDESYRASSGAESLARELAERSPSRLAAALRITESVIREATLPTAMEALVDGVAPDPDRYQRAMTRDVEALGALGDDLFL